MFGERLTLERRLSNALLIAATTVGATFTVLVAGGSGYLDQSVVRQIYLAMAGIAILGWLAVASIRPAWRPLSRLAPALIVCFVVVAISTATSRFPRLSAEMLGYAVLLVALYLFLVALLRRPTFRLHLERLALVMGALVAVLYLGEVFQAWMVWWDVVGRLAVPPLRPAYLGLSLSPNPIATVVLTFGAFGLAASRLRGRVGWIARMVVVIVVLAATFITASRGAYLGAALGLVAVVVVALAARPETRERARETLRTKAAIAAVVAGTALAVAAGVLAAVSGRLTFDDGGSRAGFARASTQMLESSPLTGVGPGTWGVLRASNTVSPDLDQYIPHAHSVYWQTLAEFGIGGIVGAVTVVATLGLLILRALRSEDATRRRVGCATLFGVVLLAGQQFADMLMNVPAVLLAGALPIAWLDAAALPPPDGPPPPAANPPGFPFRIVPVGMAIVIVVILTGLARIESVAGVADQGVQAANDGDWQAAMDLATEAVEADPGVNIYQFQLGVAAANAGDLELAERSLLASATADDYRYAWLDLAAVRWELGDETGSRQALERAERLGLQRTALAVAAGWLRQQLGDNDAAIEDYAIAVLQLPTLVDDPFWSSPSGPVGGLDRVLEVVRDRASPITMLQIHLILGRLDLAQAEVERLTPSDPELYANLIRAWDGDPQAWAALQAVARSRPRDTTPASWCRLVATYLGDAALARRYAISIAVTNSPDHLLPIVGRLVFDSAVPLPNFNLDAYGTLYRRQLPASQVVRLLPQLTLVDSP